jgi:hypothetical protein
LGRWRCRGLGAIEGLLQGVLELVCSTFQARGGFRFGWLLWTRLTNA